MTLGNWNGVTLIQVDSHNLSFPGRHQPNETPCNSPSSIEQYWEGSFSNSGVIVGEWAGQGNLGLNLNKKEADLPAGTSKARNAKHSWITLNRKVYSPKCKKFLVKFLFSAMFNNLKQFYLPQFSFFFFILYHDSTSPKFPQNPLKRRAWIMKVAEGKSEIKFGWNFNPS